MSEPTYQASSVINQVLEAVIGLMNATTPFATVTRGALPTGPGLVCEIGPSSPETVHMDRAVDFVPTIPRPYLSYGSMFRASPTGVWGEPTKGTAEKGEKIFERCAEIAVEQIENAFAYMEKKEKFNYSYF